VERGRFGVLEKESHIANAQAAISQQRASEFLAHAIEKLAK
jgi:hypothetical protein